MVKASDLNINWHGNPVPGFSGGSIAFGELERLVGGVLPAAYVDFLRCADGGHPEISCFLAPGTDMENIFDIDCFYSVANPELESIKSALEKYGKLLGPKSLPIAEDGGGNQFYLSLSTQPSSVWLYLHDEGGRRIKLANSFEEFISGLFSNPDHI